MKLIYIASMGSDEPSMLLSPPTYCWPDGDGFSTTLSVHAETETSSGDGSEPRGQSELSGEHSKERRPRSTM